MDFEFHRPMEGRGKGDRFLPEISRRLKRILLDAQALFEHDTLRLPSRLWEALACVLVELAEDLHNDIGIWRSYEQYNREFYGTALPLVLRSDEAMGPDRILEYRIRHLLWVLYAVMKPELVLCPTHGDLCLLAKRASGFLERQFARVPRGSGVKAFLSQPNRFGWEVKRKLVWLGVHSYLFRHCFGRCAADKDDDPSIAVMDDFVCQETTCWSGMGAIDILAATLDLGERQRSDLRSWHERHASFYRILEVGGPTMKALNTINEKPYLIRVGEPPAGMKPGQIVLGSLVPWDGEWYWSGSQEVHDDMPADVLQDLKQTLLHKSPKTAYRYCDDLARKARESARDRCADAVKYFGNDLMYYPDGLSMAADRQKQYRLYYESQPVEKVAQVVKEHNLPHPWPTMSLPPEILEHKNGVGIFFNPEDTEEIMLDFNDVLSAFKKRGGNLTDNEAFAIRALVTSEAISPRFVRRMVQEYGGESIASTLMVRSDPEGCYLEYFLRRYKGHWYRNRYPSIAFV